MRSASLVVANGLSLRATCDFTCRPRRPISGGRVLFNTFQIIFQDGELVWFLKYIISKFSYFFRERYHVQQVCFKIIWKLGTRNWWFIITILRLSAWNLPFSHWLGPTWFSKASSNKLLNCCRKNINQKQLNSHSLAWRLMTCVTTFQAITSQVLRLDPSENACRRWRRRSSRTSRRTLPRRASAGSSARSWPCARIGRRNDRRRGTSSRSWAKQTGLGWEKIYG